MTGTFDGEARFEGAIATGARLDLTGCDVLTVRDGKIVRNDAYMNAMQMARQLGVLPPRDPPGTRHDRRRQPEDARRRAARPLGRHRLVRSIGRPMWKPWAMSTP